jgi:hypothetical protein
VSCGISLRNCYRRLFLFTVIRLEGMRLMRLEKSWRPIVTVEIDKHNTYETTLGVDGQNINQKEAFNLCVLIPFSCRLLNYFGLLFFFSFLFFSDQATLSSILQVNVWQRSQSKKKNKKRNLVASSCHCLGELLKKQEHEQSKLIFFAILYPTVRRR